METAPEIIARKFLNRTDRHIFLTGKAGTGKTTFLRSIVNLTHKRAVIAAPTGVAAINAGGVTLHSLFQLPFGSYVPSDDYQFDAAPGGEINTPRSLMRNLQMHTTKRRLLQEIELLIIDEVSMLRADILDAIDRILRSVRRKVNFPYGGVQILFIGDLLQLPPVVKDNEWAILQSFYNSIHFFEARALQQSPPLFIELEKIYRQSDPTFINLLNHFRDNSVAQEDVEILNKYYKPGFTPGDGEGYIHLTTHNRIADNINRRELARLPGETKCYQASVEKEFNEHQYPIDSDLELKKGAQVMFIKNDSSGERRFFNGKIGVVSGLDNEAIEVTFNDGTEPVLVEKYTWYNKKYKLQKENNEIKEHVVGSFTQYPLKLAWAVTIHKSQGLTFEKAIIDVEKAFAPGQIYVALSRLVSLEGLVLSSPIPRGGFGSDNHIASFAKSKIDVHSCDDILKTETHRFLSNTLLQYYDFSDLENAILHHLNSYNKDEKRSLKQSYRPRIVALLKKFKSEYAVAQNFQKEIRKITATASKEYISTLFSRTSAARDYFEPRIKGLSHEIVKVIEELNDAVGVKQYIRELQELESFFYSKITTIRKSVALVEAIQQNQDLEKQDYVSGDERIQREALVQASSGKKKKKKKAAKGDKNGGKKTKGESAKQSCEMAKKGMSISEIAKERQMAVSTIQGHLTEFLRSGDLEILELLDEEKVGEIRAVVKRYYKDSIKPVKHILGDNYSYGEIKMVMAAK